MDFTGRKVSVKANQLIVSACTGPDLYRWLLARDSFLISQLARRNQIVSGDLCPLWVKSRHVQRNRPCPLYRRKQTFRVVRPTCAKCQKRALM